MRTTCEALLTSLASAPETKKPQKATADTGHPISRSTPSSRLRMQPPCGLVVIETSDPFKGFPLAGNIQVSCAYTPPCIDWHRACARPTPTPGSTGDASAPAP